MHRCRAITEWTSMHHVVAVPGRVATKVRHACQDGQDWWSITMLPPRWPETGTAMTDPLSEITPEVQRGWDAALLAVRSWHESQAKRTLILARRNRFPKNLEREAEVHQRSAELIATLSPDDV